MPSFARSSSLGVTGSSADPQVPAPEPISTVVNVRGSCAMSTRSRLYASVFEPSRGWRRARRRPRTLEGAPHFEVTSAEGST